MTPQESPPSLARFIAIYAAANAGAVIAFVPLLMLILPLKAEQISPENKLQLLSIALLFGGIVASVSNIAAGWLSDRLFARSSSRAAQIGLGLLAVLISLFVFAKASTPTGLVAAIALFQICLNVLFSPLGALLADKVPHRAKGRTAALLNLGMPLGTLVIAILTLSYFETEASRLLALGGLIAVLVTPIIFAARVQPNLGYPASDVGQTGPELRSTQMDLLSAWIARFSVQVSGAVIFGYILFYLQDVIDLAGEAPGSSADTMLGQMSLAATPFAIIIGLCVGYVSDRLRARKAFLIAAALMVAVSLTVLVVWPYPWPVLIAYVTFSAGLTAYLTIDTAIVTQIVARSASRARTLGVMNLTNTLPAILTPGIALILSSSSLGQSELIPLIAMAAVLALIGAFAASRIRTCSFADPQI